MADTSGWEIATAIGTIGATAAAAAAAGVSAFHLRHEVQRAAQAHVGASLRLVYVPGEPSTGPRASGRRWVRVWNNGPAVATGMWIECDVPDFIKDKTQMPAVMGPGQPAEVELEFDWKHPIPLVTVHWTDGRGAKRAFHLPKVALGEP